LEGPAARANYWADDHSRVLGLKIEKFHRFWSKNINVIRRVNICLEFKRYPPLKFARIYHRLYKHTPKNRLFIYTFK